MDAGKEGNVRKQSGGKMPDYGGTEEMKRKYLSKNSKRINKEDFEFIIIMKKIIVKLI